MRKYTKIIAVDFDGTLFTDKWPEIGTPIWPVINRAKREQAAGAYIILWTCREGKDNEKAVEACMNCGLIPDAVNANSPEHIAQFSNDPRKVGADEYWDDRSKRPDEVAGKFRVPSLEEWMARYKIPQKDSDSNYCRN